MLVCKQKDNQEYGLPIPKTMLTKTIKQSESYQMFIKYSTGRIPPKKSRGKGSKGKKTIDTAEATIDKVTITANDNIVPEPDVAFKVGKCISLTEAAEEEATRQVHATHARIVTEPVPEPARRTPLEQNAAKTIKALKERVLDEENVTSKANVILGWGSKQESEYSEEEDDDDTIKWVDTDKEEEKKDDDDDKSIDLE
nr:hypothetical protein [Tanacetum cinerariifolium]